MDCERYEIKNSGKRIGKVVWLDNEIRNLDVEREFRKQGYGRLLLKHAEEQIKNAGYQHSYLLAYTEPFGIVSNNDLKIFYAKCGYFPLPFYKRWWYDVSSNRVAKYLK